MLLSAPRDLFPGFLRTGIKTREQDRRRVKSAEMTNLIVYVPGMLCHQHVHGEQEQGRVHLQRVREGYTLYCAIFLGTRVGIYRPSCLLLFHPGRSSCLLLVPPASAQGHLLLFSGTPPAPHGEMSFLEVPQHLLRNGFLTNNKLSVP